MQLSYGRSQRRRRKKLWGDHQQRAAKLLICQLLEPEHYSSTLLLLVIIQQKQMTTSRATTFFICCIRINLVRNHSSLTIVMNVARFSNSIFSWVDDMRSKKGVNELMKVKISQQKIRLIIRQQLENSVGMKERQSVILFTRYFERSENTPR